MFPHLEKKIRKHILEGTFPHQPSLLPKGGSAGGLPREVHAEPIPWGHVDGTVPRG